MSSPTTTAARPTPDGRTPTSGPETATRSTLRRWWTRPFPSCPGRGRAATRRPSRAPPAAVPPHDDDDHGEIAGGVRAGLRLGRDAGFPPPVRRAEGRRGPEKTTTQTEGSGAAGRTPSVVSGPGAGRIATGQSPRSDTLDSTANINSADLDFTSSVAVTAAERGELASPIAVPPGYRQHGPQSYRQKKKPSIPQNGPVPRQRGRPCPPRRRRWRGRPRRPDRTGGPVRRWGGSAAACPKSGPETATRSTRS